MKETVLKGRWTDGYLFYGYDIADHKFVINEFEANIIRNIYKNFIDGVKIKDIVQDLNEKGIKNKLGKIFSSNYVSRILRNERYIGKLSKTYESDEKAPQIIDNETFEMAQSKFKSIQGKNARYKADEFYYLSGKTVCGYCGSLVTADSGTNHSGTVYRYYKCSKRKKKGNCKKSIVQKDWLENKVIEKTIQDIFKPLKNSPELKSCEKQLSEINKKNKQYNVSN